MLVDDLEVLVPPRHQDERQKWDRVEKICSAYKALMSQTNRLIRLKITGQVATSWHLPNQGRRCVPTGLGV